MGKMKFCLLKEGEKLWIQSCIDMKKGHGHGLQVHYQMMKNLVVKRYWRRQANSLSRNNKGQKRWSKDNYNDLEVPPLDEQGIEP